MRAFPVLATLLLLSLGGTVPRAAAADDRATRIAHLVTDLEALARWCSEQKLFAERNATYEQILQFDPDHHDARKWLKYRRTKEGGWERRKGYKPPRNFRAPPSELAERRARIGDAFADATLRWLEHQGAALSSERRAMAVREALAVAPHRKDLRDLNGEQRDAAGTWVLRETVRSRSRRPALAEAARVALAAVPAPRASRPTRAENASQLHWTAVLQGRRVRVLGTPGEEELAEALRSAEACFPLFEKAFPGEQPAIPGLTIMLLQTAEERDTLLRNDPHATDAFRKWAGPLASGWLPKSSIIYGWSEERERRLEWSVRQPIGGLLRRRFGVRSRHGWAFEGFGLYLSYLITGRRQTFFVRRTPYGEDAAHSGDLWDKLKTEGVDWRREARKLLASDRAPDLRLLLGKDVNTMNAEDMLTSYVLAAFVLEGRGPQALDWLEAIGSGTAWQKALEESLGLDVEGLGARLRRWLDETAGDR